MAHTVADVRRAHALNERRRLRDARPDLPAAFIEVVEHATDPEPAQPLRKRRRARSGVGRRPGYGRYHSSRWRRRRSVPAVASAGTRHDRNGDRRGHRRVGRLHVRAAVGNPPGAAFPAADLSTRLRRVPRGSLRTAAPSYGAAWSGSPIRAFSTRPSSPESAPLNLPDADILAVSRSGEVAVSLDRRYVISWAARGRLARVQLGGGAPREVLDDVESADWSPDGSNLSVIHAVGGRYVLEFPIGHTLIETEGWLSHVRVARDGQHVALLEHP